MYILDGKIVRLALNHILRLSTRILDPDHKNKNLERKDSRGAPI
jgi:hypothetical protein